MRTGKLWLMGLLLTCVQVIGNPATSEEVSHQHLLWKVASAANTLYLLGSIHFGTPAMYPLDTMVMEAFAASDALVVEIDILAMDPAEVALLFTNQGTYPTDTDLQANVGPATWRAVRRAAERYGLPMAWLQRQKPWFAAMNLSALALRRAGYSESHGIDMYFLQQAQGRKPIIPLESVAEQIAIFERFSRSEEQAFLLETLRELEQGADYLQSIIEAWSRGDAQSLDVLMNKNLPMTPELSRVHNMLLTERNVTMTQALERLLESDKTYFVVVGAGHLVGDGSIVRLFKDKGYSVKQL